MWKYFEVEFGGKTYQCEAKIFDLPSMWGINNGRISKLYIYDSEGEIIWGYERGWPSELEKMPPKELVYKIVAMFPIEPTYQRDSRVEFMK